MSKLIMFNLVSLDGFFEGPDGSIDWHNTDEEFEQFSNEQLDSADGLVFGRVTYELMAGFWPTATVELETAARMNRLPKFVASRTLRSVDWEHTTLLEGDVVAALTKVKEQQDGNLFLFGSANLGATLSAAGLIDEYRLLVNPVVLGGGRRLFEGDQRLDLELAATRPFANGNVLLTYRPRA